MSKMRKVWATVAFVLVSFVFTSSAFAGSFSNQRISTLAVYGATTTTPYVIVTFSAGSTSPAGCTNGVGTTSMTFDASTNRGKVLLSLLTSAFLAGKPVNIVGSGSCIAPGGFLGGAVNLEIVNYATVS